MSRQFFKRYTVYRGDGRELYFTPINTIEKIVKSLITLKPELKEKTWVDPCAGDGRWEQVINGFGIKCYSFDIKPLTSFVTKRDFLEDNFNEFKKIFFIGNPPFSLLTDFIGKALYLTDSCYFLGGSQIITNFLSSKVSLLHRFEGYDGNQKDLRSKLVFNDTLNKQLEIWCCGAIFNKRFHKNFKMEKEKSSNNFRVSIQNFCVEDERVKVIYK